MLSECLTHCRVQGNAAEGGLRRREKDEWEVTGTDTDGLNV